MALSPLATMNSNTRTTAARTFLRSLNILLKFTRLYGFAHVRSDAQFRTAWSELQSMLAMDSGVGFLLGVSGTKLLLDGVPVEGTPAERSFAELLGRAGLASIAFTTRVTAGELAEFVKAFALAGTKPGGLAAQLKAALGDSPSAGIRMNEIRFVAEDAANTKGGLAGQIAAQALATDAGSMREWLNDPQKLLQMIVAAEGVEGGRGFAGAGSDGGSGSGAGFAGSGAGQGGGSGAGAGSPGSGCGSGSGMALEEDVANLVRLLSSIHHASQQPAGNLDPESLKHEFTELPTNAQEMLRQALASLPAIAGDGKTDGTALLKLAEHMAIRFALRRFERGEVKVNAVRQMMDRMGGEIEHLRKILTAHEEKMSKSGILVESHADILDRQFWAAVPESGKRAVLLSDEAYCVPPRNVRQHVTQLVEQGRVSEAVNILMNYAGCVQNRDADARRRTAIGLSELAELYAKTAQELLGQALRLVGEQVSLEEDREMQALLGAAFARLSQEASTRRNFSAMRQALESLARVEARRSPLAESLRPRIGVENRLGEFMEEALRGKCPAELMDVLRRVPRAAAEQAAARFSRSEKREECRQLSKLVQEIGAEAVAHLRRMLHERPAAEAVTATGLLSELDVPALEEELLERLPGWDRAYHDAVVRQIASAGAPERGRLLVVLMDRLDPVVWSEVVDEIGMSGDTETARALLALAQGERGSAAGPYIQVKAIEALGRLRAEEAAGALRKIVETRQVFRWAQPNELRVVAAQALQNIDPEWAAAYLPKSGLSAEDLGLAPLDAMPDAAWLRQRRYARVKLPRAMNAVAETSHGEYTMTAQLLSLGGGLAVSDARMTQGVQASLKMQAGLRPLKARVLMRRAGAQHVGFEFVEMDLEERARLRKLLAGLGKASTIFSLTPVRSSPQAVA
ncbi:MAG: PilZ domain-containing protein [Acidobacteria bacterium]|nr:PilZ domain-containing protein [Acidobacteriota bacterium]